MNFDNIDFASLMPKLEAPFCGGLSTEGKQIFVT